MSPSGLRRYDVINTNGEAYGVATIQNSIWIHADRITVFERTNDIAHWTDLFTEYKETRVLEQGEAYIRFEPDDTSRGESAFTHMGIGTLAGPAELPDYGQTPGAAAAVQAYESRMAL